MHNNDCIEKAADLQEMQKDNHECSYLVVCNAVHLHVFQYAKEAARATFTFKNDSIS